MLKNGGIAISPCFQQDLPYTFIAALDVNGFVNESCEVVERVTDDLEMSKQGALGTVDADNFCNGLKNIFALF